MEDFDLRSVAAAFSAVEKTKTKKNVEEFREMDRTLSSLRKLVKGNCRFKKRFNESYKSFGAVGVYGSSIEFDDPKGLYDLMDRLNKPVEVGCNIEGELFFEITFNNLYVGEDD